MKTLAETFRRKPLALAVTTVLATWQAVAVAQEEGVNEPSVPEPVFEETDAGESIEEVVVTGRFISSSQQLVNERMNDAFSTDLLGADTIARLGDSTVAAALRRVPGLSLVQDKFVYIRVSASATHRRLSTAHRFLRPT